jgi:hypothetical protein
MSSRIRFTTARDVFETFADLRRLAPAPVDDAAPLDYARRLLASKPSSKAILFMAHLLPRREAVWWARQCVGAILGPSGEDEALRAAEAWVRAPEEENRRAALAIGAAGDRRVPTTWLARAAGWSGGSRSAPEQKPMPPQPSACASAANAAIILAIAAQEPIVIRPWIRACVEAGIRFAEGGEAKVLPPAGVAGRDPRAQPRG